MKAKDFQRASARLAEAVRQADVPDDIRGREQAHLRSVHEQIDAIARGDVDGVLRHAHTDVQLDIFAPPEFEWIRQARGVDELRRAIVHNFESVSDQQPEITNIVAQGDTVVLIGRERGTIRATGKPYDVQFVERFAFRDARLAAVQIVAAKSTQ